MKAMKQSNHGRKRPFALSFVLLSFLGVLATLTGCNEDRETVVNPPFVYFMLEDGTSQTVVNSDVNAINTYYVYLSAEAQKRALEVNYEVIVGNGLTEGVDYLFLTPGKSLTFQPGVYDMPIRIKWLPNPVSTDKDNSLTIRLTGSSRNYTLGVPGPDHKNKELIITKQ